ncbi:MAG TPA: hypothetical protein VHB98_11735, partial [Chloroflexota bacterium]|nr:hypothetical protein [Chloroflexota bacterium]
AESGMDAVHPSAVTALQAPVPSTRPAAPSRPMIQINRQRGPLATPAPLRSSPPAVQLPLARCPLQTVPLPLAQTEMRAEDTASQARLQAQG